MDKNRFQLGAKKKIFPLARDVKRFDSHAVARQNQPSRGFSPQSDREHSAQPSQAFLIPLHEGAKNGFRVGMRLETMTKLFQFVSYFDEVVDFTIEGDSEIAVFGQNRLIPAIQSSKREDAKDRGFDCSCCPCGGATPLPREF